MRTLTFSTAASLLLITSSLYAGTTSVSSFLEPSGARPAALGEAFSAVGDDITAFSYNPASLGSLKSKSLSLMYQKGIADDSYGQILLGSPTEKGGLGLSVGYYNGGKMDLSLDGTTQQSVTAKKDLTAALGYSFNLGSLSLGLTGKYVSSELAATDKASAFAGDAGLQIPIGSRIRFGAAIQNMGSSLKYVSESSSLPQIARAGLGISLFQTYKTTLLLDAPYYINNKSLTAGAGLETMVGPLALRAGYRTGSDLASVTFGAGFLMGGMSLDYSYGLVQDLQNSQRVSLAYRFGGDSEAGSLQITQRYTPKSHEIASKPETTSKPDVTFVSRDTSKKEMSHRGGEVYTVQPGDTLGKIALSKYGDADMWKQIYAANRYLMGDNKDLTIGQRIVLP